MSKITKEELKAPDAFVSTADRIGKVLVDHSKSIVTVLGVAVAAWLVWIGYGYYDQYRENKAALAIYEIENKFRTTQEALEKEKEAKKTEEKTADGQDKPQEVEKETEEEPPVDFEKTYGTLVKDFKTAIDQHQGTRAALVAASELAGLYIQFEKHDEAIEILTEYVGKVDAASVLHGVLKSQLATELTYKEKWQEALDLYQDVLDNKVSEYLHPDILLKMGLVYEKLNDLEKAKDFYLRASTEYSDSETGRTARAYLRLLEFKEANTPKANKEG